jgi:trehalose-phosphatase
VDLIERFADDPGAAALFLDVDGALAPIVEDPDDSSVPETTRSELRRLAGRYGLVACVTGRPEARAREIVGVPELRYAGEHGLELEPEAEAWAERLRAFVARVDWPAEQEKRLTASFHYRRHPDPAAARAELEGVREAALAEGFRARWGRMVLEVVPPVDASKGTAVRHLLDETGLRRALYAGDDTTDLDGFRALDGLEVAVRVAVASPEGPDELGRLADVVVQGPEGLAALLRRL